MVWEVRRTFSSFQRCLFLNILRTAQTKHPHTDLIYTRWWAPKSIVHSLQPWEDSSPSKQNQTLKHMGKAWEAEKPRARPPRGKSARTALPRPTARYREQGLRNGFPQENTYTNENSAMPSFKQGTSEYATSVVAKSKKQFQHLSTHFQKKKKDVNQFNLSITKCLLLITSSSLYFCSMDTGKRKKSPQNGERENKNQEPSHPFPLKKIHGEKMIIPVSQMTILRFREVHRPSCFGPCEKKKKAGV